MPSSKKRVFPERSQRERETGTRQEKRWRGPLYVSPHWTKKALHNKDLIGAGRTSKCSTKNWISAIKVVKTRHVWKA